MTVYLFSENKFLYNGLKSILEEERGLVLKLVTVDSLMHYCYASSIKEDDIFLVSTDSFNITLSILVMLDYFSSKVILFYFDSNTQKVSDYFSLLPVNCVAVDAIGEIVEGGMLIPPPRIWQLTYKEASVLSYRLQGMSIYNVNDLLAVSAKTVYSHQRQALIKIGVKTIAHLHRLGGLHQRCAD